MKKYYLYSAALLTCSSGVVFADDGFLVEFEQPYYLQQGTVVDSTTVWAGAAIQVTDYGDCNSIVIHDPGYSDWDMVDASSITVQAFAWIEPGDAFTTASSYFSSFSNPNYPGADYVWYGFVELYLAGGVIGDCKPEAIGSGNVGGVLRLLADGMVDGGVQFPPPACFTPVASPFSSSMGGRTVEVNMICASGQVYSSALVAHGSLASDVCDDNGKSIDIDIPQGTILEIYSRYIKINDSKDDVTGDSRFNQDDVDYLSQNVVGTAFATDPLYADRFDYINSSGNTSDDGVDVLDILHLQCFVDSGHSSGFVADSNGDSTISCADLHAASIHPFAGELFTGSVYKVEYDTDLDGDNDTHDKAIVALAIQPADLNADFAVNQFDNSQFITWYNASDSRADLNNDGNINFFDVSQFLTDYKAACQ